MIPNEGQLTMSKVHVVRFEYAADDLEVVKNAMHSDWYLEYERADSILFSRTFKNLDGTYNRIERLTTLTTKGPSNADAARR